MPIITLACLWRTLGAVRLGGALLETTHCDHLPHCGRYRTARLFMEPWTCRCPEWRRMRTCVWATSCTRRSRADGARVSSAHLHLGSKRRCIVRSASLQIWASIRLRVRVCGALAIVPVQDGLGRPSNVKVVQLDGCPPKKAAENCSQHGDQHGDYHGGNII